MESIAAVSDTLSSCAKLYSQFNELKEKYKNAKFTIIAITAQINLTTNALHHIQELLLLNPTEFAAKLGSKDSALFEAFDIALVGSKSLTGLIEDEVQKLCGDWAAKLLWVAWNESLMEDILTKLTCQVTTFNWLLQCLQLESIAHIHPILRMNQARLQQIANDTAIIRASSPQLNVPESILDPARNVKETFTQTVVSMNDDVQMDVGTTAQENIIGCQTPILYAPVPQKASKRKYSNADLFDPNHESAGGWGSGNSTIKRQVKAWTPRAQVVTAPVWKNWTARQEINRLESCGIESGFGMNTDVEMVA
ncbi:hypothetical protein BT63DRAFT_427347 [Microthyrium microscopicum]|uniref:Fungal N-terminal domain-containing protein n=1 Tax=Microthyrium microscopicum TaxID=703497 RepID=A0A6A6U769_9PEZI|nr:hypothetical protein BT63DRAFT_427347 [Microthyrium microscopicum]